MGLIPLPKLRAQVVPDSYDTATGYEEEAPAYVEGGYPSELGDEVPPDGEGGPTLDQPRYGSTEQGGTMIECCEGSGFHSVLPDQLFHEIVDQDTGHRLDDGQTGLAFELRTSLAPPQVDGPPVVRQQPAGCTSAPGIPTKSTL